MSDTDLEDRIANVLCDVLDEPEAYTGCVLAINKKTLEVTLANPSSLGKDYATYPIDSFITNNDEGDIDLDLSEISYVASRHEGRHPSAVSRRAPSPPSLPAAAGKAIDARQFSPTSGALVHGLLLSQSHQHDVGNLRSCLLQ